MLRPAAALALATGPSVGGQRPRNNDFTIEGVDNNNKGVTGPLVMVPNDAVAEFSLLENQFSPEFGHSSGGQFNTVVKSGTNSFHGVAYVYNQNRNYDAFDSLNGIGGLTSNPRFDNNRFGGQIGGPIDQEQTVLLRELRTGTAGCSGHGGRGLLSDSRRLGDDQRDSGFVGDERRNLREVRCGRDHSELLLHTDRLVRWHDVPTAGLAVLAPSSPTIAS